MLMCLCFYVFMFLCANLSCMCYVLYAMFYVIYRSVPGMREDVNEFICSLFMCLCVYVLM
jgi:hypothetical protein